MNDRLLRIVLLFAAIGFYTDAVYSLGYRDGIAVVKLPVRMNIPKVSYPVTKLDTRRFAAYYRRSV